ncbi:MAG: hypothetical protein PHD41_02355 [Methanosarcinaceae archaeon]|nr:hypothetical protein [Methanosarcinaceae archaeon]MDD4331693.1 hypothetical protein [Methanosarcinaceae archaeon]MDD4748789.1 hypothetical protein [Methanosarcinaceae archaeon]
MVPIGKGLINIVTAPIRIMEENKVPNPGFVFPVWEYTSNKPIIRGIKTRTGKKISISFRENPDAAYSLNIKS